MQASGYEATSAYGLVALAITIDLKVKWHAQFFYCYTTSVAEFRPMAAYKAHNTAH